MITLHFVVTGGPVEIDPAKIRRMCRTVEDGMEFTEVQVGDVRYCVTERPTEISALMAPAAVKPRPTYAEVEAELLRAVLHAAKACDGERAERLTQALINLGHAQDVIS